MATFSTLLYRAQKYDEADKALTQSIDDFEKYAKNDGFVIFPRILIAITKWRLGQMDEAKQLFAATREPMIALLTSTPSWDRRRTIDLLYEEAESLIGPSPESTPPESAAPLPN